MAANEQENHGRDRMGILGLSGPPTCQPVWNHPRAVMPVSGIFFDEDNSYLGMQVTVQTMRFSEYEALPVSLAAVGENRPHSSS